MKKHHFYLWLIALTGLITSCSQDVTDTPAAASESNLVTFTASLPQDFAKPGTRYAPLPSQTGYALRCIIEVWTRGDTPVLKHREEQKNPGGNTVVFRFEVDPGTYDCLFWTDFIATDAEEKTDAQIGNVTYTHYADKYYVTNDATNGLKAISILADNYNVNTDARDAFFGNYELDKGTTNLTTPYVTLTRPFAKLTIKEKTADAYNLCKEMTASYTVPNAFDVLKGTASGSYTAFCGAAPAGDGSTDLTLLTDYILTTSAARETMPEISLTFTKQDAASRELQSVTIPAGVPVQRNYRTNAAGNLISEQPIVENVVKITVDVNENWTDENYDFSVWDGKYPQNVTEAKQWLGTEVSGADDADGKNHVFEISTAKQLCALKMLINQNMPEAVTTNKAYSYATYKLTADINLNDHQWIPLGSAYPYSGYISLFGVFDGQGHTISGLNISQSSFQYSGLFALNYGTIKHLMVKGNVEYTGTKGVSMGGIIGENYGTIAFSSFEGTAKAPNGTNETCLGWICGKNLKGVDLGRIISCFAKGTISGGTDVVMGGMTGMNTYQNTSGTILGCTWYYKSGATPEGIAACYPGWTSGGSDTNASYSDDSELSNRVSTMNQNAADYDYQWQADGNTLKLVAKTQ